MNNEEELWNKICDKINNNKDIKEEKLQFFVENDVFYELGWKKSDNYTSRPTIPFGSKNYGIPDLILQKNDKEHLICIELKRYVTGINNKNEVQLFSYMRALKLSFGILFGNVIQVYYDDFEDKNDPIQVCEIQFNADNKLGVELLENLEQENFSKEKFTEFCKRQIELKNDKKEIDSKSEFLCSDKGIEYVKNLLLIEYPKDVVDNLNIYISKKRTNDLNIVNPSILLPKRLYNNINYNSYQDIKLKDNFYQGIKLKDNSYERLSGEKIQDWVKRILTKSINDNKIDNEEMESLHNLEYSKTYFGIDFPLLCDNYYDIFINNHQRYWSSWKLVNKYFVCSQW
jgi:hypothetical protein